MNKQSKMLNEGLRSLDLEHLVAPVFEVDTFKSKMGEDRDVCTISFTVQDRAPAKDLMEFLEKGYNFVLDADVSSGETEKGEYSVFVEIHRTPKLAEHVDDLLHGVRKLTGIKDWQFKFYKNQQAQLYTENNFASVVPSSPRLYEETMTKYKVEETKKFFNKTLLDDIEIQENTIVIKKPFGVEVRLEKVSEGNPMSLIEGASIAVDDTANAEIFWLTKVLGDYNISKYGDTFLFTNDDKAMLLKRSD